MVERFCSNCGNEITYRHSYSSCDCCNPPNYWHLYCPEVTA